MIDGESMPGSNVLHWLLVVPLFRFTVSEKINIKQQIVMYHKVCLFDLILYVPVNNLSVTSGRVFLS